jgi:hypothetical protein
VEFHFIVKPLFIRSRFIDEITLSNCEISMVDAFDGRVFSQKNLGFAAAKKSQIDHKNVGKSTSGKGP